MRDLNKNGELILNKNEHGKIKENFLSASLSDKEINLTIKEVYNKFKLLIDPHTAVGVGILKKISIKGNTIVLATAHPAKFPEVVLKQTNLKPELPQEMDKILTKDEKYQKLSKSLNDIQNYILERK